MIRRLFPLAVLALAGCASNGPAPVEERSIADAPRAPRSSTPAPASVREHVVMRGDTLYGIAFRYGVDLRDLVRWNGIADPNTIYPGQRLKLAESRYVASRPVETRRSEPRHDGRPRGSRYAKPMERADRPVVRADERPLERGEVETRGLSDTPVEVQPIASQPPTPSPASPSRPIASRPAEPTPIPAIEPKPVGTPPTPSTPTLPPSTPATPKPAAQPITPGTTRSAGGIAWRWPARGSVLQRYTPGDPARQGIDIQGKDGDPVLAAADGEVVYSGNGLLGYGELVIVKHSPDFLSAYAYNRSRLVKEGDKVKAGQQIAEMGRSGAAIDLLHFEIRHNGKPVDPMGYLPKP